jgi:hypothetical protein
MKFSNDLPYVQLRVTTSMECRRSRIELFDDKHNVVLDCDEYRWNHNNLEILRNQIDSFALSLKTFGVL